MKHQEVEDKALRGQRQSTEWSKMKHQNVEDEASKGGRQSIERLRHQGLEKSKAKHLKDSKENKIICILFRI